MSNSIDDNKFMDNVAALPAALRSYVPKQLLKHVDTFCELNDHRLLQSVLDNSIDSFRVYGCEDSFLSNLWIYMDFPLRRKMFPGRMGCYNYTIPDPYTTLKGDVLYCKQDYLFHLQSCVYSELKLCDDEQSSKYAELIEYMKKHEERLSGCYEFVKYDHETFESIRKLFFGAASLQVVSGNAKVPVPVEPPRIIAKSKNHYIKVFDDLISKYPCLFLPNSETKDKNATAVVRVFGDSVLKFVMESELVTAVNLKNPDRDLKWMQPDGQYRVLDYKGILGWLRDEIADIDFIHHQIAITDYRPVPIVTPAGDHCVQAADALQDILRNTSIILGVFQKLTKNTYHMIPKFVAILEKYFPSNIKYRYFINLKMFQKIQEELDEFWKPIENVPVKRVRNVGSNGFTAEGLKKELDYLEYTETFPEISAVSRFLYTLLFQTKKPNELKTADMFRAIEACLVTAMFRRFSYFQEFMHRQKFCFHNRAKPCDCCLKGFRDAEEKIKAEKEAEQASMSSAVTATTDEIIEDENPANPADFKNSEDSESKPVFSKASNNADLETIELKNEESVVNPDPNPVSPDSSSAISNKCMETSNEAREEVVETYRKIMIPEKTLKEKDAELERLRIFEQKSKKSNETERKMKDLEKEAEEWKMKHLKVLEENVKMGNMFKNTGDLKALESQLKERDEQLSTIQSMLKDEAQRCEKLEKTIEGKDEEIHELSEAEKSEKQEKEGFKATVNNLLRHLVDKDKEIAELKKTSGRSETCEELKQFMNSFKDLEKQVELEMEEKDSNIRDLELKNSKISEEKNKEIEKLKKQHESLEKENKKAMKQLKEKNSIIQELEIKNSRIIEEKNKEIEKLKKEKASIAKENQKEIEQLKEANSVIRELELKNSQITEEKNKEIEKLRQQQASVAKETKKEIEKLKRNASKSAGGIKKLTAEKEAAENRLKQYNIELLEKLRKSDFNLQEITKKNSYLETEISEQNRIILGLRKSAENQISEQEKAKIELETLIPTIRGVLDRISLFQPKEEPECLICFYEMRPDQKTLKCDHCRKVVHFECASKWLKIHRSCAHCRREQLDPNEFPSLQ